MRPFVYEPVSDAAEAVAMASVAATAHVTSTVQFLGGGTTLIDLMKLDVMRPTRLIDITGIRDEAMHQVTSSSDELRIGSLVSMGQLQANASVVRDYPLLTESLWQAASQQLRNMARLGGNVLQRTRCGYFRDTSFQQCNKRVPGSGCAAMLGANRAHAVLGTSEACIATYPSDWAPALMALDAEVEVLGQAGKRRFPLANLHRLPGQTPHIETNLMPGELILAFIVPGGPRRRSLYRKIRDRQSYAFANAGVALALELDGDMVKDVRLGLAGVATVPWRASRAEEALIGKQLTEANATVAAEAEFQDARPRSQNAFKITLGIRTMVRALLEAKAMEIVR